MYKCILSTCKRSMSEIFLFIYLQVDLDEHICKVININRTHQSLPVATNYLSTASTICSQDCDRPEIIKLVSCFQCSSDRDMAVVFCVCAHGHAGSLGVAEIRCDVSYLTTMLINLARSFSPLSVWTRIFWAVSEHSRGAEEIIACLIQTVQHMQLQRC